MAIFDKEGLLSKGELKVRGIVFGNLCFDEQFNIMELDDARRMMV